MVRNRVQPEVQIQRIVPSPSVASAVDIVVNASERTEKAQPSGLQDLRLFRDGQLVAYREGRLQGGDFVFSGVQLPTMRDKVVFSAYAFNGDHIKSATAVSEYSYQLQHVKNVKAWLIQIGVNKYKAAGCDLHGAVPDADLLSTILSDRLLGLKFDVHPFRLLSTTTMDSANKESIRQTLAHVAALAMPDDVLFLSFSGHGYMDTDGEFYIMPSDVQGACSGVTAGMLQSAVSATELTEWLRPIDAGEMTLILDSCDSAGSVESRNFKPGPMGSRGLGQLAYDKRMRVLAASQANQAARESPTLGQGLLTYTLTELGLINMKADWRPVDGKITIAEWLSYAVQEVPKAMAMGTLKGPRGVVVLRGVKDSAGFIQTPVLFNFSKTDTFVLERGLPKGK